MEMRFAAMIAVAVMAARTGVASNSVERVKPVVAMKAEAFDLKDVRLLESPFKHAQELDRAYLHRLDPDRLLYNFRKNAGIPTDAKPYGGWEEPKGELRGHFTGHYLSACAKMYAATGDEELKRRAVSMVGELAKCQDKLGGGYLSAFPTKFIDRVEARKQVWAPYYTLHKILAGLLDVYTYCGDKQALEVARRFGDWVNARNGKLTDAQMQAMLGTEHGGMNESLANLYAVTGDAKYLAISRRFNHHFVMDPLASGRDTLTGLHANTQIPKFIGNARQYELTGDKQAHDAALNFWTFVSKERSYVIGGHSDGEMFTPKEHLSTALGTNTTETCNTYNMLKLTRHLFEWSPKSDYADFYERALYNHILASQNPETGMMCYYVPLRSGTAKNYNTPENSFWCCTGTGVENHAQYGDSIYFHDGGSALYVNLFMPSELTWRDKGVTVRQETRFPEEGRTRFSLTCAKPARFTLKIRKPFWVGPRFTVTVSGATAGQAGDDGYVAIEREWKTGDTVDVELPMTVRTEAFRDDPHRLAFLYGPIVLCAETKRGGPIPVLVPKGGSLEASLDDGHRSSMALTLSAEDLREEYGKVTEPVALFPFYRSHDKPQMVYWDVLTPDGWDARLRAHAAELERAKALDGRTVDRVQIGNRRSESAHRLAGERDGAGPFNGRMWRHAPGGWFSYDVKVDPAQPMQLLCTYWGSDAGGRVFDILVDGRKVATERLENNRPGEFFDRVYDIPADLLAGKDHVTVRFEAKANSIAGGVFEVRMLRK
jgi:DUF1680 family protein